LDFKRRWQGKKPVGGGGKGRSLWEEVGKGRNPWEEVGEGKENNGRGRNKNKAGKAEITFCQRISEAGKAEKAVAEIVFMPVRAI